MKVRLLPVAMACALVAGLLPPVAHAGTWFSFTPPDRRQASLVLDTARDRVILGPGLNPSGSGFDLWEFPLSGSEEFSWQPIRAIGEPHPGDSSPLVVYDSDGDRVILFGGFGAGYQNAVTAMTFAHGPVWESLAPTGTPPDPRAFLAGIHDPVADRVVFFGGAQGGTDYDDVWVLDLSGSTPAWSSPATSGTTPSARSFHTAVYDPANYRMLVWGGDTSDTAVHALDLNTFAWTQINGAGAPADSRFGHVAVYDIARESMLVFGGNNVTSPDVLELDLGGAPTWSSLTATVTGEMLPRAFAQAVYVPDEEAMFVHGGVFGERTHGDCGFFLPDIGGGEPAWLLLSPSSRHGAGAVLDPVRNDLILFGGEDGTNTFDETWCVPLDAVPVWAPLQTATRPPARTGHAMIYDPVGDAVIVFGGKAEGGGFLDDVWALVLSGSGAPFWTEITPAGGPPPARWNAAAIHDPVRNCLVIHGGDDGLVKNDVWQLSLSIVPTWTEITPGGLPPSARQDAAAVYDPAGDRMVIFGGDNGGGKLNDTWAINLSGAPLWSAVFALGSVPPGLSGHSAHYHPTLGMVVQGGSTGATASTQTRALDLSTDEWSTLPFNTLEPVFDSPAARHRHAVIYDPGQDRLVTFGGVNETFDVIYGDAHQFWLGAPVSTPERPGIALPLSAAWPNPSRGATQVRLTLTEPTPVSARVVDIAGRLVRDFPREMHAPGERSIRWDGRDGHGRGVPGGVYFLQVTAGARTESRRVVRLP